MEVGSYIIQLGAASGASKLHAESLCATGQAVSRPVNPSEPLVVAPAGITVGPSSSQVGRRVSAGGGSRGGPVGMGGASPEWLWADAVPDRANNAAASARYWRRRVMAPPGDRTPRVWVEY